jgi:hypothetical protein
MTKQPAILASILLTVCCLAAHAQKLPNVQAETGLRAPADMKTDGKATEWGNQFKAYNHATDVFYTISNDDERLYLTLQATDPTIINKILRGSVAFSINTSGKKNDKGAPCISYPIFAASGRPSVGINKKSMEQGIAKVDVVSDSVVAVYNRSLKEKSKFIEVTGIAGLDTLISVYNSDGIKAAQLFDNRMAYTIELAIDLKLLDLSANNTPKIAYHIALNGVNLVNLNKSADGNPARTVVAVTSSPVLDSKISLNMAMSAQSFAPTDFWGEYILAKK